MNEDFLNLIHNARQLKASLPILEPKKILVEEKYTDDILPFDLYRRTRQNIEKIADQINKSFYYAIYDGAAILMRRLIEMLLILAFKRIGQEDSIRGSGGNYLQLSEIINCAIQNRQLDLSRNAKDYFGIFKEKGDLSAHNPFYNCRKKDLALIQHKFRSLIEELFYKAGILE
ncbi:MAG: hypothetical protein KAV98_03425 [Dehalococcoidia bacterium]|nr:hypothetical protein [Dehalococcoidia bacterium]